jgi:hypothetical protein
MKMSCRAFFGLNSFVDDYYNGECDVTVQSPPYLMLKKSKKAQGNERYEGYCADLAQKLSEQISFFKYNLKLVSDNAYGAERADGTWNGMIGELQRGVGSFLSTSGVRNEFFNFGRFGTVFYKSRTVRFGILKNRGSVRKTSKILYQISENPHTNTNWCSCSVVIRQIQKHSSVVLVCCQFYAVKTKCVQGYIL